MIMVGGVMAMIILLSLASELDRRHDVQHDRSWAPDRWAPHTHENQRSGVSRLAGRPSACS
jgi:hypothetical protein